MSTTNARPVCLPNYTAHNAGLFGRSGLYSSGNAGWLVGHSNIRLFNIGLKHRWNESLGTPHVAGVFIPKIIQVFPFLIDGSQEYGQAGDES
jgi:hypothetical protein